MDAAPATGLGRGRVAITGATTISPSYAGLTVDATSGTFSVAFSAVATLGSNFHCAVYNSGSGVVTLDPNGSETIRTPSGTSTTLTLQQGQGVILACDGSAGFEALALPGNAFGGATTDNAVARYDGTNGKLQNSGVLIDDSNNVATPGKTLVGATSLDGDVTSNFGTPYLAVVGDNNAANAVVQVNVGNTASPASFFGAKTRSTGTDANVIVQNGDGLVHLSAFGADGAAYRIAASIRMEVDGTPGSSDMPGRIVFLVTPDGTISPAESFRINNSGTVTFAASKTITVPAGIIFANETLSTYDEGTWTPTLFGSGTAGTPTYVTQSGRYTRIGRIAICSCYVEISAKTGIAGDVRLGGLPFTIAASTFVAASVGAYGGFTFAAGRTQLTAQTGGGVTYLSLGSAGSLVAYANTTDADIAASTFLIATFSFQV